MENRSFELGTIVISVVVVLAMIGVWVSGVFNMSDQPPLRDEVQEYLVSLSDEIEHLRAESLARTLAPSGMSITKEFLALYQFDGDYAALIVALEVDGFRPDFRSIDHEAVKQGHYPEPWWVSYTRNVSELFSSRSYPINILVIMGNLPLRDSLAQLTDDTNVEVVLSTQPNLN